MISLTKIDVPAECIPWKLKCSRIFEASSLTVLRLLCTLPFMPVPTENLESGLKQSKYKGASRLQDERENQSGN
jgi:hypothetical protein